MSIALTKNTPWNNQQVVFECPRDEFAGSSLGDFREQIECAPGLGNEYSDPRVNQPQGRACGDTR